MQDTKGYVLWAPTEYTIGNQAAGQQESMEKKNKAFVKRMNK